MNKFLKFNIVTTSLLTLITLVSLVSLLSISASAESASVSVNVATACSFSSTLDSEHSATIPSGTYKEDIGETTFKVICNDSGGYSVYAVGYGNNEFGNTNLLATVGGTLNPSFNIATLLATSGNTSSWAMKLTPASGTFAPTIESDTNGSYSDYHIVPSTYTKVATFNSTTDPTSGSSFTSTYRTYISGTQPAGTYQGKVKYTMVHPASDVPTQPYDTTAGFIGYYPNASGVTDTMADQGIANTATSAELWASNFKRSGYGFVGWSDKYDWVLNENDTNGNGTIGSSNEGYHIYGPNQTINFTAGQYSGTNKGLSLYAVWAKSAGSLQNWQGCGAMSVGQVTALTDQRDNNTYAVAKLADNKCWMIENLRLGGTTTMTLDSTTTNIAEGTTFTLSASTDPTQTAWCTDSNSACTDQSMLASNNTTNTKTNMTSATLPNTDNTGIYSMGNYYNWYSATAGTGTYSMISGNTTSDICPKGWHLPTGGNSSNSANSEFWKLGTSIMGFAPSNNTYYQNTETNTNGKTATEALRIYPNNFIYSGLVGGTLSSINTRGSGGGYWSSTVNSSSGAYNLTLNSTSARPGTNTYGKRGGFTTRCTVGS